MQPNHAFSIAILAVLLGGCATNAIQAPAPVVVLQPATEAGARTAPLPTVTEATPRAVPIASPPPAAMPPAVPQPAPTPSYPSERDGRATVTRLLPPKIQDRTGWAADIFSAFAALHIPASTENFCAAIAVIEQESNFQSDPVVPGLARIVWGEIEKRRKRYGIPKLVVNTALLKSSPDGRSYKARIDALRTERQMNALFEDMISELPDGRRLLAGYNPIRTGGPMQVSIEFAEGQVREKHYPYPRKTSVRDEVFTRRGGVYFGIADLLDYPANYTQPAYRFADFNAGRYSSRNAAFQAAVSRLSGRRLALDGDLLRYEDGIPSRQPSATQQTLLTLARQLRLGTAEIARDLRQEKTASFTQTPLYQRVFNLADQATGRALPRETMPQIKLKSPKIHRRLTTEWFADRVDWRYRNCLGRGL